MKSPKVSVIIPVYNVEEYLPTCLDSIINQTLEDIEIICVNDGSPDNCLKILNEYAKRDSRIIVINQENRGVSGARNHGLETACGKYIVFVDPDDWCEAECLEKAVNEIENDNEVDMVYWGLSVINERDCDEKEINAHRIANRCKWAGKIPVTGALLENLTGCIAGRLFKTEIIRKHNIHFSKYKCSEDLHFNLSYWQFTRNIFFIPENLYHYVLRQKSATATMAGFSNPTFAIDNIFNLFKEIYAEFRQNGNLELFDKLIFRSLFQRFMFNISFLNKEQQDYYLNELRVFFTNLDKSYDWSQNEDIQNILNGEFYKYYHLQIPYYSIGNKLAGIFLYKNERSRLVVYLLGIKLSLRLKFLDWRKEI